MWLHFLVCLMMAAPSFQELKIHENPFDGLSYGEIVDIARIQDQVEVCANENKCDKKKGSCISKEDTCNGESYIGKKWCANSETCQCCVVPDCQSKKNTACSVLNGTCIGINEVCDGQVATDRVFCKNPSTCKCCFPKPKEVAECELYTCGLPNIEVEQVCSESHTHLVGGNTTFTSNSNINITEQAIGIRFLPGVIPELETPNRIKIGSRLHLRFESPEYTDGFFIFEFREQCSNEGCKWYFWKNTNVELTGWSGTSIDCLPKNEWILLKFRTINNKRNLAAYLTVRGGRIIRPNDVGTDIPINATITSIKADVGNREDRQPWDITQHYTEISLDCDNQ